MSKWAKTKWWRLIPVTNCPTLQQGLARNAPQQGCLNSPYRMVHIPGKMEVKFFSFFPWSFGIPKTPDRTCPCTSEVCTLQLSSTTHHHHDHHQTTNLPPTSPLNRHRLRHRTTTINLATDIPPDIRGVGPSLRAAAAAFERHAPC